MKVLIYKICCPISLEIRYIGQTTSTLEKRLKQHLSKPTGIILPTPDPEQVGIKSINVQK